MRPAAFLAIRLSLGGETLISYAVVGHTDRIIPATELAKTLGATLSVDDGTAGSAANHLRAWELTAAIPSDYGLVIEDDAELVDDFTKQAAAALAVAPTPVASLYLGRSRPRMIQRSIPEALAHADKTNAHWIVDGHRVLHAVAVAIRTELRDDWLDVAAGIDLPADERLTAWCQLRGHRVCYSVPSLVNHHDWPTLINRPTYTTHEPRRAWRVGTRDAWNSTAVPM